MPEADTHAAPELTLAEIPTRRLAREMVRRVDAELADERTAPDYAQLLLGIRAGIVYDWNLWHSKGLVKPMVEP